MPVPTIVISHMRLFRDIKGSIHTGGLFVMPRGRPPEPVATNYFGHGFNSVRSVVAAKDGSLWFTDPSHGHDLKFRREPQLPCHVYRCVPEMGDLRVMADSMNRPHGIALSPDELTVYVTDGGHLPIGGEKKDKAESVLRLTFVWWCYLPKEVLSSRQGGRHDLRV